MASNLVEINSLISQSEKSLNNPNKLRKVCDQLQFKISSLPPQIKYHYELFLAELLANKLNDIKSAKNLCNSLKKDNRNEVCLEAMLRMSYFYSLAFQFDYAISQIRKAFDMTNYNSALEDITKNFCLRIYESSKDSNLLHSIKAFEQGEQKNGIKYLEIQNKGLDKDNKFFAAKILTQLDKSRPNSVPSTFVKNSQSFIDKYYEQNEHEIDKGRQKFQLRKKYLKMIVEGMKNYSLLSDERDTQQIEKILLVYKLKKTIAASNNLQTEIFKQIKSLLIKITTSKQMNTSCYKKFISQEKENYHRIQLIIDKKIKDNISDAFQRFKYSKQKNKPFFIEPCESDVIETELDPNFEGSEMEKIHSNSEGSEKRYFYFKKSDYQKKKLKLYYAKNQKKAGQDNSYYDVRKILKLTEGKASKALKRSECDQFSNKQCFTIELEDFEKNFFVPDKRAYQQWIILFRQYMRDRDFIKKSKISNTKISQTKQPKIVSGNSSMTASKMTKSKKVSFQ